MMIVGVLGHTDITTAQRHYIRGQQKRAFTMYQDEILAIIEAAGELAGLDGALWQAPSPRWFFSLGAPIAVGLAGRPTGGS